MSALKSAVVQQEFDDMTTAPSSTIARGEKIERALARLVAASDGFCAAVEAADGVENHTPGEMRTTFGRALVALAKLAAAAAAGKLALEV